MLLPAILTLLDFFDIRAIKKKKEHKEAKHKKRSFIFKMKSQLLQ